MTNKTKSIHVIGAGTFGLSTALELARKGYTNITCYDKYAVPSPIAAGNDSNKIFGYPFVAPDEEPTPDEKIQLDARDAWKNDPVFNKYYHPVGLIEAATTDAPLVNYKKRVEHLKKKGLRDYEYIDTPEGFKKYLPVFTGDLPGWRGYVLDDDNGWLHARDSLKSAFKECEKLGVKFVFGDDGEIIDIESSPYDGKVMSIKAKSGKKFTGDKFILTAGANVVSILNFEKQLEGKCFTLAHIKVTDEEAQAFKGLPVIFNSEKGFFFEPDENNEIKICNEFPGFTNYNDKGESVPLYKMEIPLEAANEVRQYLKETIPQFADRPFVKTRICWITDSPDRELILCQHPQHPNLTIGSGDSGLSFMLMPVIGKYIAKIAIRGDDALEPKAREAWKWRPEQSKIRDDKQGRWGGRGIVADLRDIDLWVSVENPEPHSLQW